MEPDSTHLKPIAICQHDANQGPAYLQQYLQRWQLPYRIFAIDQGEAPPQRSTDYSGIVVLGSNASVNDRLRWIRQEEQLLSDALQHHIPILGTCFGGQLLAKVLGAKVRPNAVPQIGWDPVRVTAYQEARHWLGQQQQLLMFHWHFDTFQIPAGCKRLLYGRFCLNKAFSYGPNLALQSHLEVTADSVRAWCTQDNAVLQRFSQLASVQTKQQILTQLPARVALLHQHANYTYQRWLAGLPGIQRSWQWQQHSFMA